MTTAAGQYGQALYALAREEQLSEELLEQMGALLAAFREEPAFLRLLTALCIPKEERCDILDQTLGGKIHPYLLNFLKILTQEGLADQFANCYTYFRDLFFTEHGWMSVCVDTAWELTDPQKKQLTEKLEAMTGKTVLLETHMRPDYLGGMRIRYDGFQIDGTVQGRLDAIGKLLKNTLR